MNLKVWGDEWDVGLGKLTATLDAPGKVVRAWGHPVWVRGDVQLAGERVAAARARRAGAPVRRAARARPALGVHLDGRDARRPRATGSRSSRARSAPTRRRTSATTTASSTRSGTRGSTSLYVLLLGLVPALLVVLVVYLIFGRERSTGYDREYEQEPPTDTEPALVPTLLRQGGEAGSFEFTATLFDLIRRGVYAAKPVTTERSVWAGLRTEQVADLEISAGDEAERCARGSARSPTSSTACSTAAPCGSRTSATASRPSARR